MWGLAFQDMKMHTSQYTWRCLWRWLAAGLCRLIVETTFFICIVLFAFRGGAGPLWRSPRNTGAVCLCCLTESATRRQKRPKRIRQAHSAMALVSYVTL